MRREGYIIEEIVEYGNMSDSFDTVLRGTKRKRSRQGRWLLAHRDEVIRDLTERIASGTFTVKDYREREIVEGGKLRKIQVLSMYDRIGVHAVINVVDRHMRKRFIRTTSASIKERGMHDLLAYIRRDLEEDPDGTRYCYKFDISKFYDNVQPDFVMYCVKRIFKDKRLIALLDDFPEYCCLIFVYDLVEYKPNKTYKKIYAALSDKAQEVRFEPQDKSDLINWIARRFRATGHDIDARTAEHLMFTCGSLMTGLVPEIAKIAAYARGPKITAADIDAVADPVLDARVFDMTDAVAARDYDKAAEYLAELLRMQEEPIRILAALGKTLRQLYTARLAIDGGKDVLWLKDLWRMKSDYPAKKLMQSARGVRRSWCREAVKRCQTLDHRMKSERNMDSEGELKLFLMELAGVK